MADVIKVVKIVLELDISATVKKRLLVHLIWEITRIGGDFKGRYRAKGVLIPGVTIQRDHVYQKSRIVERLLKGSDRVETLLDKVVHCVVTKEEHRRLTLYSNMNPTVDGWNRYSGAGVEVVDMLTGEQLI